MVDQSSNNNSSWKRLNNASNGFSLISCKSISCVYRLSADLYSPVLVPKLQLAVDKTLEAYPEFRIQLKAGFFWHFYTQLDEPFQIQPEVKQLNQAILPLEEAWLFRLIAGDKRIAVEYNHTLTDGSGALEFFQHLLDLYFQEESENKPPLHLETKPAVAFESDEDPYLKMAYDTVKQSFHFQHKAYRLPGKQLPNWDFKSIRAMIAVAEIKAYSKEKAVSITETIVATYLYSALLLQEEAYRQNKLKKRKVLRVMVPVNMRSLTGTKTMQNFFLYVAPEIDPRLGDYSFEDVLKHVHHSMRRDVEKKRLNQQMKANLASQWSWYVRIIPLFIKRPMIRWIYKRREKSYFSGMISNLGLVRNQNATEANGEVKKHIKNMDFLVTPQVNNLGLGMITYEDTLVLNFGRITDSTDFEKMFIQTLSSLGINARVGEYPLL